MNVVPEWILIWRALAVAFLRDGYCSLKGIERWAREHKRSLRIVGDVLDALLVESFEHDGEPYLQLSGKVVPLLPRDVRDVRTYRQAGSAG